MSRLDELIKSLCPDGVEYKRLKDVASFSNGKGHEKNIANNGKYIVVNSKFISTNGTVKKFSNVQICPLYVDDILMVMSDLPNGKALAKCYLVDEDDKYTLNQRIGRFHTLDENIITTKFLFNILNRNHQLLSYDNGIDQTNLRKDTILNIYIPIPPIPVQQEIIRLLDDFTAKTAELQSELNKEFEARKKQYEHYEETLLNGNGATKIRLGDICHIKARIGWQGLTRKEYLHKGDYYLITGTDFSNGQVDFKNCHYVNKERYDQDANIQIQNNDVLVTKDGTLGKVAFVTGLDKPATLNAGVFVVRPTVDNINPRYLYYLLASKHLMEFAKGRVTGGTIKHLNQSIIVDFPVPLLDFENQSEIVNMLDTVNALYNTLQSKISSEIESRQKQYEFYRDKLLTFKELNESEVN